jgi:hypothetical protein
MPRRVVDPRFPELFPDCHELPAISLCPWGVEVSILPPPTYRFDLDE